MADTRTEVIDLDRLRIGHFVFLDLGWISHPFPLNNFRIQSLEQIETIRSLGIDRVRYSPERSSPEPCPEPCPVTEPGAVPDMAPQERGAAAQASHDRLRRALLAEQHASLQVCEREFGNASRSFCQISGLARAQPGRARDAAQTLVARIASQLIGSQETCIRLLSEKVGERAAHEINVTVLSLLLGKAFGLGGLAIHDLGLGALLHDVGKIDLPDRLRYDCEQKSSAEQQLYRDHVGYGVAIGRSMGLATEVLAIIAQHHEHADGSGYPARIANDRMSPAARIVALVNRYDTLCNPANPALTLTPHETLSQIFAHARDRFDAATVNALVRMMGVYPPGSVVQLTDDRYALVVSVNALRPLKPRILIHDAGIPREEALEVDLADHPALGIRRSLRPLQLPRAVIDYLSPRIRVCYFFERARGAADEGAA